MPGPKGYDHIVECPYNKSHQIENGRRFQIHLDRCRKEYERLHMTTSTKKSCPFNVTHIVNDPELQHHIHNCPDRKYVDHYQNPIVSQVGAVQKKPTIKMLPQHDDKYSEDWDDEPATPTYDPAKYCANNKIIRHCNGMQPHERNEFRKQEHLRLSNFPSTTQPSGSGSGQV